MTPEPARNAALVAGAREVIAVLVAAAVAGVVWLIPMQEAWKKGWTEHDANAAMGDLVGATGDQVARQGLLWIAVAAVVLAVLHAVATAVLPRHWLWHGVATGVVIMLAWGLVFAPVTGDRTEYPGGFFGLDAGTATLFVGVVAALAAGLAMARVHALVRSADWWERKHFDLRESIEGIFTEEKPEKGETGYRPEGFTE